MLIAGVNLVNVNFLDNSGGKIKISLVSLKTAMAWETEGEEDKLTGHEEQFDSWMQDDIDIAIGRCGVQFAEYCNSVADGMSSNAGEYWTGGYGSSVTLTIGVASYTMNFKECDPGGSGC